MKVFIDLEHNIEEIFDDIALLGLKDIPQIASTYSAESKGPSKNYATIIAA